MANDNSIFDKMIEMGMGMTMAREIPRMMDTAMGYSQQKPQVGPPPIANTGIQLYAAINNSQAGPFNEQEFIALIQKGLINTCSGKLMPKVELMVQQLKKKCNIIRALRARK